MAVQRIRGIRSAVVMDAVAAGAIVISNATESEDSKCEICQCSNCLDSGKCPNSHCTDQCSFAIHSSTSIAKLKSKTKRPLRNMPNSMHNTHTITRILG